MSKRKPSKATVVRVGVMLLFVANTIFTLLNKGEIPFTEGDVAAAVDYIYIGVSVVGTAITTIAAAWKNNSFTNEAIEADKYKEKLKANKPK